MSLKGEKPVPYEVLLEDLSQAKRQLLELHSLVSTPVSQLKDRICISISSIVCDSVYVLYTWCWEAGQLAQPDSGHLVS